MGVLKKEKLIFCHIAKNGGQTVHGIMEKIGKLEICDKHYSLNQIKEILNDDKLFNESYKFCIVRNPYERMVSTYFFRKLRKEKDFGPKKQWDLNFSDWIKYIYSNEYKNLNLKHGNVLNNVDYHFGSSIKWVMDTENKIIADKIIKFENMNSELLELFSSFGFNIEVIKRNSTNHKHYREYYDDISRKLVEEHFIEDIKYFDYKF